MPRLNRLILIFSVAFAVLFVGPSTLSSQFGPYPLIKLGDVLDLLTPLVLIPLYWILYQVGQDEKPGLREGVAFMVLAALWVLGHGMHLAANSIGHLLREMVGSDAYVLTYFYDETLGHILWHSGVIGLSALLLIRQWQNPFTGERASLGLLLLAGIIYGLTFFVIVVEGGTALLGIPFALIVIVVGLVWGKDKLREQPLLFFFLVSYVVAILFFAGWGLYWGGLPEFSALGFID
ncbi:MAG: hypothetical protein GTO63_28625 [Anaerolineae bacterium]|nr:hypothetical protein [Anaerolineae bacterium]NIN98739.1 hypothetical protein [Anaerolineae bacterium]